MTIHGIPANDQLTPAQLRMFVAILKPIHFRRIAPTIRQLGRELGIRSPNGTKCHMMALAKKKLIAVAAKEARAIRPLYRLELFKEMK